MVEDHSQKEQRRAENCGTLLEALNEGENELRTLTQQVRSV